MALSKAKELEVIKDYVGTECYNQTAKNCGVNDHTVKSVIERNADTYEEEKAKFVERTTHLINKALMRLDEGLDRDDIPLNNLTTAIGTLYDKRALAKGDSTSNENQTINIVMSEDIKELSK